MPLYEYECTQCKRHTEKIQKFSDPEIVACPHCGGKLERVITAPSVQFKGGGWFSDGYSSSKSTGTHDSSSSISSATAPSNSDSASSSSSASESKPATPATPAPSTSSDKK
ncbi:MAG: zinc ribbon domain-containing protein [Acidobacteriaceae bacterium]|nr:zinc ribbon domain-containing protein [Acidobacteriaceae bacterium]